MHFECDVFSCFPEERETLFFGGDTVLRIKGIVQWAEGKWRPYDKYMEPINAFCRMMNGLAVREQPIITQKSSQKAMKLIAADILRALMWQQQDAKTPKYVRNMVLYHHSNASRVRLLYDELLTVYQWLDCILKSESADCLNFANIAVLFCHSDDITFLMPKEKDLSETECSALINDIVSIAFMALGVQIRLLWPTTVPKTTKSRLTNASMGLHQAKYQHHFDSKTISFTTTNSSFNVEAQDLFQRRIQQMIQRLSHVPISNAPLKEKVAQSCLVLISLKHYES